MSFLTVSVIHQSCRTEVDAETDTETESGMETEKRPESEIRTLAEFIHQLTWEQLPDQVREAAVFRVLDLVSTAAGAADDPLVKHMADACRRFAGEGNIHVWGRKETYSLSAAAMLNGMLAHTLELDDVHPASKTHGSASLIPAAWACAEYLGSSGKDFLTAVVCGYETVSRIGMALGVSSHRSRGWHATATCGVFGCAAACAKLLKLNTEQIISALGMAGTQSSGVWAFLGDGSNCKILHPGRAAANGLEAVFLAQAGMTGPEHILDAKDGGLLYAMSDGGDGAKVSEGLGETWEILKMDMKPYPCCRSTHSVIDCALKLRKGLNVHEIASIHIGTYLVGYKQCAVSEGCLHPKSVLDAKFSAPYAAAAALLYGKVTMAEFEPEVIGREELQTLVGKIKAEPEERFTSQYPKHWSAAMTITMKDKTVYQTEVTDPSGSMAVPLTRTQVMEKAEELLHNAYPGREQEIIEEVLKLADAPHLPVFEHLQNP